MKSLFIFCLFFMMEISFAQSNLEKQLSYANELFDSTDYFDAITEYKRLIYFDVNKEYYWEANYKIGLSYKSGGF